MSSKIDFGKMADSPSDYPQATRRDALATAIIEVVPWGRTVKLAENGVHYGGDDRRVARRTKLRRNVEATVPTQVHPFPRPIE